VRDAAGKETTVWSGVNKGPPRTLKWPEHSIVIAAIKALKL
jgi:hypothetical protein